MHIFYMKILHLVTSIVVGGGFGCKGMVEEQLEERETLRKVSEANHWFQSQMKDYQREVEESRIAKEELATQVKESEKKQKTLEAELIQLQEDLALSERARKSVESERDELHEEINNSTSKGSLLIDEKRRLEARIQQLEEEMEEEQGNSEVLLEKVRKSQTQIEQLMADLGTEKATSQMLENSRMMLERQNKELKLKLQDIESSQRAKSKTAIASLESKLAQLEEQLEEETREKQSIAKSSRKLEKRVKELLLQLDDERRYADQYKEQYLEKEGVSVTLEDIGKQTMPDGSILPLPPILLGTSGNDPKKKTVCIYGHLDVQPAALYCAQIWLGKYDSKSGVADFSTPDKRREFMRLKYEEKKFYVDPREAIKKMKPPGPVAPTSALLLFLSPKATL